MEIAKQADVTPGTGMIAPTEITLGAIGVAAVVWGGKFVLGRLKQDAAEKTELAESVKRSGAALATLGTTVSELQVSVAKCETHREHDAIERARLFDRVQELEAVQRERLKREEHEGK